MNGNEKQSAKANLTELGRAVTLVMALFIASRALGLARQMVIGSLFGAGSDLDAYLAAARISETVFLVITGGALGSAFIPAFAGHLAKKDHVAAWRLASATVNLALIALTVVAGLMALLAPTLVQTVIAPGFAPPQQALTASLLRLMLVSPIIFGVSGIVMGVLNAHQHFLLPALAPSVYNLSIIGGALLLGPRLGVRGIAAGVVAGAALHLLVQMPGLLRYGARYIPTLGLDDPSVREVGRLMAPRMLGTAITQLNFVVNNSLASGLGVGAVSAINYAWLLMMLPQGVFAQAVGTAAFPTFAAQAARGERDEMRHTLAATLRSVFALCLPATVGLLALGQPLVGLLFERGAFESSSTEAVAWALAFYALGLVGHAGLEIIARAFYALHDTFTPVWVGGLAMGLNVALSLTLPGAFGSAGLPPHAGLALANSAATLLELAALMALIRRRLDGLEGRRTLIAFAKSGLASLAMGAALIGWRVALPHAGSLAVGGGGVLLGAVVYVAAALILRMEELRAIANLARRRPG
ncbi:MAG TPA: murein biosynthesis integral membrane protein MurJ [Thermoflexia bacterium]|nr:murein biosynthesis integral membrane protein MurJ [Thermoflexia bacterium]